MQLISQRGLYIYYWSWEDEMEKVEIVNGPFARYSLLPTWYFILYCFVIKLISLYIAFHHCGYESCIVMNSNLALPGSVFE